METFGRQVLRLAGKILAATTLVSLAVLLVGRLRHWNGAFQFSSGFFIAGAIVIVLGILSIAGGFSQRANFGILYAESAGQMSSNERNQRMLTDVTQRYGNFILMLVTGLLLIAISVIVGSFL